MASLKTRGTPLLLFFLISTLSSNAFVLDGAGFDRDDWDHKLAETLADTSTALETLVTSQKAALQGVRDANKDVAGVAMNDDAMYVTGAIRPDLLSPNRLLIATIFAVINRDTHKDAILMRGLTIEDLEILGNSFGSREEFWDVVSTTVDSILFNKYHMTIEGFVQQRQFDLSETEIIDLILAKREALEDATNEVIEEYFTSISGQNRRILIKYMYERYSKSVHENLLFPGHVSKLVVENYRKFFSMKREDAQQ